MKIDRVAGSDLARSAFIEPVRGEYFRERARKKLEAREMEIIYASADGLSAQAEDALEFQADPE